MKTMNQILPMNTFGTELNQTDLFTINGGKDGDLAYIAGYVHVFTLAHFATGGLSTYYYLYKKFLK
jgi:hypothetical protein